MTELERAAAATPARVFTGRVGTAPRTRDLLRLRADHAAARDAVATELDTSPGGLALLTGGRPAVLAPTLPAGRAEYLRRPDLGRRLSPAARETVAGLRHRADLQLVVGDGLSARAVAEQVPALLDALLAGAGERGWSVGDLVVVTGCRVGVLNDVGELLDPSVVVLLIGERPGLASPASLSAYLAFRPRPGDTDAQRNLVAGICAEGLSTSAAAARVLGLAESIRRAGKSGVSVKEAD